MLPLLLGAAGVGVAPVTPAFAAETTSSALRACAAEADDARRLACFDRVVAGLDATTDIRPRESKAPPGEPSAAVPGEPSVVPAGEPSAAPVASPAEQFGLPKAREEGPRLDAIEAKVVRVSRAANGIRTVTLDNGQVWTELESHSGARFEAGDSVTIKAGAFRSFDLVAPNKRSSKVRRAR
jgi:hypothetical protein